MPQQFNIQHDPLGGGGRRARCRTLVGVTAAVSGRTSAISLRALGRVALVPFLVASRWEHDTLRMGRVFDSRLVPHVMPSELSSDCRFDKLEDFLGAEVRRYKSMGFQLHCAHQCSIRQGASEVPFRVMSAIDVVANATMIP